MSKKIIFSNHARERMASRGISESEVNEAMANPDRIIDEAECKQVFQKISGGKNKKILRVFVNTCKEPSLIITAYKTSKIDKYEY